MVTSNILTINVRESTIELCNWGYNHYDAVIRASQSQPEITWDIYNSLGATTYKRPGIKVVLNHTPLMINFTDLSAIRKRFNYADTYKNSYDYGVYLFYEEFYNVVTYTSWHPTSAALSTYIIDGTDVFEGITVELLKPWYIRTRGSWNQEWWDAIKAANNYNDSTLKEWSYEYTGKLFKAWKNAMNRLGKKTAFVGWFWIREEQNFESSMSTWFGPNLTWIIQNTDWVMTYTYPSIISDLTLLHNPITLIQKIRNFGYNGLICYNLGICFSDRIGCPFTWEKIKAEFDIVKTIPNIIISFAGTTRRTDPELLAPKVISWYLSSLCTQPSCTFSIS